MSILFDKTVPVGVRRFSPKHMVHTFVGSEMEPQLNAAQIAGFDVMTTAYLNIRYQQKLTGRKLSLVVLGSNISPIVQKHSETIAATVEKATPGSYDFI